MAKGKEELSHDQLLHSFKAGKFPPILFMQGEEPYYLDNLTHWLEKNALPEEQQGFNQTVLYGRDVNAGVIINASRRFPMMFTHQLVLIKEAQNLNEKELENLLPYFNKPLTSTVLAFAYKGKVLDRRKKVFKALEEQAKLGKAVIFTSIKEKDYLLDKWIANYVASQGFKINPETAVVMAEYLGNNLEKIANELSKLAINIPLGSTITTELIEKYIGISRDYNIFELQNAIGKKDIFKAYQIANYFAESPKASNFSMAMCISNLYQLFNRLYIVHYHPGSSVETLQKLMGLGNSYFVKDYLNFARNYTLPKVKRSIATLLEYDLKAKGLGSTETEDGELLKEMIYKLVS